MPDAEWYSIQGINPEPWEASEGSVGRKGGKVYVQFHKPRQLVAYQEAVAGAFQDQNGVVELLKGQLDLKFFFWRRLDQFEFAEGRKRRQHAADATNLQKALEDALQGILFKNDRDNRRVGSDIMGQGADEQPFILIRIEQYKAEAFPAIMRGMKEVDEPVSSSNRRTVDTAGTF